MTMRDIRDSHSHVTGRPGPRTSVFIDMMRQAVSGVGDPLT
jgi:hypothetical protein